jgi:hypothetical protein
MVQHMCFVHGSTCFVHGLHLLCTWIALALYMDCICFVHGFTCFVHGLYLLCRWIYLLCTWIYLLCTWTRTNSKCYYGQHLCLYLNAMLAAKCCYACSKMLLQCSIPMQRWCSIPMLLWCSLNAMLAANQCNYGAAYQYKMLLWCSTCACTWIPWGVPHLGCA